MLDERIVPSGCEIRKLDSMRDLQHIMQECRNLVREAKEGMAVAEEEAVKRIALKGDFFLLKVNWSRLRFIESDDPKRYNRKGTSKG